MNKSSAANMARRAKGLDGLDDYPTPPWATRALLNEVWPRMQLPPISQAWEPAAGRGHMSRVLEQYSLNGVMSSDIHDYGAGFPVIDYLTAKAPGGVDRMEGLGWVITNPPFRKARNFVAHTLNSVCDNLAILCRLQWTEGVDRFRHLFDLYPPRGIAVFSERVGMTKGKLDPGVGSATAYAWYVWTQGIPRNTTFFWIPPCREKYTEEGDYDEPEQLREQDRLPEEGSEGISPPLPLSPQGAVPAGESVRDSGGVQRRKEDAGTERVPH